MNVTPAGQFEVEIDEVGIYIKDSYDFEGDQSLGYWDPDDNSVGVVPIISGGDKVENEDFRDWRAKHSKGGDFRVYSDVKRVKLTVPDRFTL